MRYLETTAATRQKPGSRSDFPSILGGFPHSEIHGSKGIRTSPWLIAAYHVLHRLCMPRHPPIALKTLDCSHCQCPSEASLDGDWQQKDQLLEICPVAAVRQANHVPEIERLRRRTAISRQGNGRNPNKSSLYDVVQNRHRTEVLCKPCFPANDLPIHSTPYGGAGRDRTDDPLLAKQVLSQLSYGPVW